MKELMGRKALAKRDANNALSVHEVLEFEISDSNEELPDNLVVKESVFISKYKSINLFDYITDLNGKNVKVEFKDRINFLWKFESGADLAKISISGKLTGISDGNVKVKLLHKKNGTWYNLGTIEVKIVDVVLPEVKFECGCTPGAFLRCKRPGSISEEYLFNEITCTITNQSSKPIKVWHNLNVKLDDWKILWHNPVGDTTTINPGETNTLSFSTDNTLLDGGELEKISYTFDNNSETIAVYWDTTADKVTFNKMSK